MSKYKPLEDMIAPSIKDWKVVAENIKVSFQKRMVKEYSHKKYSKAYRAAKVSGDIMKREDLEGLSQESHSATPDLTLTGNMLKEIVATPTGEGGGKAGTGAKLEWSGANADKIHDLDRRGKFPMFEGSEPASDDVNKDIEKYVNELYNKRVKAQSQKIVYRL